MNNKRLRESYFFLRFFLIKKKLTHSVKRMRFFLIKKKLKCFFILILNPRTATTKNKRWYAHTSATKTKME